MRRVLTATILTLLALADPASAQNPGASEAAFRQALLDLGTDLRLMCVAAHPDDEDGATLARYRKRYGLKTFAVIATRGEGGQNEIGPELYEELAVIRTHEMRAAADVTGAELHFLNLPEFGFSKTLEETFAIWGRDTAVERLVRVIRQTRPDVIISNHGTLEDHGHHQALGVALREAFDAAADPARYPAHLAAGLEPWQAARLYLRDWRGADGGVSIAINERDPVWGKTYAELAAEALQQHKSQGMQFFIERYQRGEVTPVYRLEKEAPGGVTGAGAVPAPPGALLAGLFDRVAAEDRALAHAGGGREAIKRQLLDRLAEQAAGIEGHVTGDLPAAVLAAAEVRLEAVPDDALAVPGQTVTLRAKLVDGGEADATSARFSLLRAPWFPEVQTETSADDAGDQAGAVVMRVTLPDTVEPSVPAARYVFTPTFLKPQFEVAARIQIGDGWVRATAPVRIETAPPVQAAFADPIYLARPGRGAVACTVLLTNRMPGPNETAIELEPPSGFRVAEPRAAVTFAGEDAQQAVAFELIPGNTLAEGTYPVAARFADGETAAEAAVRVVDIEVPEDIRVGVVQSYDDTFMKTLDRLGVPHAALTAADFTPGRLDRYTTIIVDIRAYLVRNDLIQHNAALLDYVNRGGTVLVMYQKTMEWKPEYAPYPIHLSRNRVTREDAPVEVLVPKHPLYNTPNTIGGTAWDGWIQERGLYFPDAWDAAYTPLVATSDPGETIPPGSVLIARYGDGTYVYTALGWYRQLRELHPGVLSIFANMLAL